MPGENSFAASDVVQNSCAIVFMDRRGRHATYATNRMEFGAFYVDLRPNKSSLFLYRGLLFTNCVRLRGDKSLGKTALSPQVLFEFSAR